MFKAPQVSSQELVGAQMNGMGVFNLKWLLVIVLLALEATIIYATYHTQLVELADEEDYRIIGCTVEETKEDYLLHLKLENLNGQEQTVEIYLEDGSRLWEGDPDDGPLLPGYETATLTYTVDKEVAVDGLTLKLHTYKPQEWKVALP